MKKWTIIDKMDRMLLDAQAVGGHRAYFFDQSGVIRRKPCDGVCGIGGSIGCMTVLIERAPRDVFFVSRL